MHIFKLIFYAVMMVGSFVMVGDFAYSNETKQGLLCLITVLAILYWLYKILNILTKITVNEDDDYGKRYENTTSNYHRRFQPNPDYRGRSSYSSNVVKQRDKIFAEKLSANIPIRNDIKILELTEKTQE